MPPPRIASLQMPSPLSLWNILRQSPKCLTDRPLTRLPTLNRTAKRTFTSSRLRQNWLAPNHQFSYKHRKGKPRMSTGGSMRGTTVCYGDYGLRMRDHDRRISSKQLRIGEEVVRRRLRGYNYRFFSRFHAAVGVYAKGNESRMGTGKGKFDHWAVRVPVSRVVFELKADCHEQVIRDALRLAANKLPGLYEFVKKGDPPVMGITKVGPTTSVGELMRPRKKMPAEETAQRLPPSGAASATPASLL